MFKRKSYNEITESIISQITKGIVNEKHEYVTNRYKYRLENPGVVEIVKVEGIKKGIMSVFKKEIDYSLDDNKIEWLDGGEKPEDHTPFFVNYKLDSPHIITDINPGSVIRTIVESVSLEIDFIYAQMEQVYNSAFIDTATGKSLDLVVSMLGITRNPAGFASGEVTFGRNNDPGEISISQEAHIYSSEKKTHELKNISVKDIKQISGISEGISTVFLRDKDYSLNNNTIIWLKKDDNKIENNKIENNEKIKDNQSKTPDDGSVFHVDYIAYEQIVVPVDTRVSTYSRKPENIKAFRTTKETILNKNPEGKWIADIPVMAMEPGKEGNIFAGSINVMPKPPMGIEYVINRGDILNGTETETDSELRQRSRHALEVAGKATFVSFKSAVQGVAGVKDVRIVENPDGIPGFVRVIASGGDEDQIKKSIEDVRSVGIKVEFKRPKIVPLDIIMTIILVDGVKEEETRKSVDSANRQYLDKLKINEDVIINKIINSSLSVLGVKDIKNLTINGKNENFDVKSDEKGELRILEIFVD